MKEYVLKRKKLTVENPFSYCPYCMKAYREINNKSSQNIQYQDVIPKLWYVKKMYEWNTEEGTHKTWGETYYCEKCDRGNITSEDFRKFYGMDADGNRLK